MTTVTVISKPVRVSAILRPAVGVVRRVGLQGPAGVASAFDANYVHNQQVPGAVWVVVHGMNKYPSVLVEDSTGEEIVGAINYDTVNQLTITFSSGFAGRAILN